MKEHTDIFRRIARGVRTFMNSFCLRVMAVRFLFIEKSDKRFILIGTPDHGNSGDIAIAVAIRQYISLYFPDASFIDISLAEYPFQIKIWQRFCRSEDIFLLIGGGNFGNQYMRDENIRRDAIMRFTENKIIMFPQSMYFTDDESGKQQFKQSQEIYNRHGKLVLFARDPFSYEAMKNGFDCQVFLAPDIVFTMKTNSVAISRKSPMICLRDDLESCLSDKDVRTIKEKMAGLYGEPVISDTMVKYKRGKHWRLKALNSKLNEFSCASIVVTDRLHGMIFAAITATPCIVFSNYNHKIRGAFQWIYDSRYIKLAETMEEYTKYLTELKTITSAHYNREYFLECCNNLKDLL